MIYVDTNKFLMEEGIRQRETISPKVFTVAEHHEKQPSGKYSGLSEQPEVYRRHSPYCRPSRSCMSISSRPSKFLYTSSSWNYLLWNGLMYGMQIERLYTYTYLCHDINLGRNNHTTTFRPVPFSCKQKCLIRLSWNVLTLISRRDFWWLRFSYEFLTEMIQN